MEEGQMTNLPGEGKPLKLDDDPYTPDDTKLAYKILKDNNMAPDWMMAGRELEIREQKLRDQLRRAASAYQSSQAVETDAIKRVHADRLWRRAQRKLAADVEQYNREVAAYNIKIPSAIPRRPIFNFQEETRRALNV
jgi:ribosomal protein L39E